MVGKLGKQSDQGRGKAFCGIIAGMLLWSISNASVAQESTPSASRLLGEFASTHPDNQPVLPFPLLAPDLSAGLPFDLGGSATRKLSFQLAEPLTLDAYSGSRWLNLGGGSVLAGTSLNLLPGDHVRLGVGIEQQRSQVDFQPLGSIHCQNGILEAGSYRASDCYFTNGGNDMGTSTITLGARYDFNNEARAAISLFRHDSSLDARGVRRPGHLGTAAVLDAGLLTPVFTDLVSPAQSGGEAFSYLNSEVNGIDLEFRLGVSTDYAGDMQLGLQFTRVMEADYKGMFQTGVGETDWTLADPFDSAAVSFDWQRNTIGGGIQGFYREPVDFLNRPSLDRLTTFDVYFTWRTPWNASLSVGASNLLNAGKNEATARKNSITDPFEAVYGRIPYVRYQQDL